MPTFAEACETVISIHAGGWKPGGRNEQNWRSTMRDYVFPRLGDMPVDAVTDTDVMAVLLPIWTTKTETAARVRRRIGAVMKWAVAQGHRADNPAGGRHLRRVAEQQRAGHPPGRTATCAGGHGGREGAALGRVPRRSALLRVLGAYRRPLG